MQTFNVETKDTTDFVSAKKILVFDLTKGFSRMLTTYLKENYAIQVCNTTYMLDTLELANYHIAFVIINSTEGLVSLLEIYSKVDNVFFSATTGELNQRLNKVEDLTILDLSQKRADLMNTISYHLAQI